MPASGGNHTGHLALRLLATAVLILLGCWSVYYSWPLRGIRHTNYTFSDKEDRQLQSYPDARYAYGMRAWTSIQPDMAVVFFRQAVTQNTLHLDAWLKLAEAEIDLGNEEKAQAILTFTNQIAGKVFRWQWPQIMLARELGRETIFYSNINYLLSRNLLVQDALQLLHTYLNGSSAAAIAVLEPDHLGAYLDWLMRWGMSDESQQVWQAMTAFERPDKQAALRYAHFLLSHKQITASVDIWQQYTSNRGLTNPSFERAITGRGFDWRHWGEKEGHWALKRINSQSAEGKFALKITFKGQANISFLNIYQIVAVIPQNRYRLTYSWKSRGITTDQGPFMEVIGYDQKGLYQAGPMIRGSQDWHEEAIEFEIPAGCHAVILRLRRRSSMRFDSKIKGIIWIDNFRMEAIAPHKRPQPTDTNQYHQHQTRMHLYQATR